ncbi:MAG: HEAT repeat domain-containing protein [Methanobacteriaceae archaeon]|nr:HEAT repeat domain-containing protein [Candidatus Methanorudis spinitermitis]
MDNSHNKRLEGQKRRGKIFDEDLLPFTNLSSKELIPMLKNNNAQKRTIAAKLLGDKGDTESIKPLLDQFVIEKVLYSRIAISESLVKFKENSVPFIIDILGKIGNNQEKELPKKYFNKKSFPLPRDLAGRTLAKMGKIATPFLIEVLDCERKIYDDFAKEQAIDAIGAIAHKYNDYRALNSLISLSKKHENNKIIQWKIIRALSGFKSNENALKIVIKILNKYYPIELDEYCSTYENSYFENIVEIQWEAIRSIGQIGIINNEINEILNSFERNKNIQIQFALKIAKKSLYS